RGLCRAARTLPRLRLLAQLDPRRGVIAGAFVPADPAVDAGREEALCRLRAQQQMIDAQPRVPLPAVSHVVPERIHRRVGMEHADCVDPPLAEDTSKKGAAFRLEE